MTLNTKTFGRWSALACALVLASGTLAACGGSDSDDSSASSSNDSAYSAPSSSEPTETTEQSSEDAADGSNPGSIVQLGASEQDGLAFDVKELTTTAGAVTISFKNASGNELPHAVEIEGNGIEEETETVQPGDDATSITVDLKAGEYTFYCPVGEHRAAGMEGTLTVS